MSKYMKKVSYLMIMILDQQAAIVNQNRIGNLKMTKVTLFKVKVNLVS